MIWCDPAVVGMKCQSLQLGSSTLDNFVVVRQTDGIPPTSPDCNDCSPHSLVRLRYKVHHVSDLPFGDLRHEELRRSGRGRPTNTEMILTDPRLKGIPNVWMMLDV